MTNQQHPITPPPGLVQQWIDATKSPGCVDVHLSDWEQRFATQAARWGADQELEACCEWLVVHGWFGSSNHDALRGLRAARRPKPPSLKEQALAIVCRGNQALTTEEQIILRRALEQLDD